MARTIFLLAITACLALNAASQPVDEDQEGGPGPGPGPTLAPISPMPIASATPTASPVTAAPVTASPTQSPRPTRVSSASPSASPSTPPPTEKPTNTHRPTTSRHPSTVPTYIPTRSVPPSYAPTTQSPTSTPTTMRLVHEVPFARMTIFGLGALPSPESFKYWADTTSEHIVNYWAGNPGIVTEDIFVPLPWNVEVTRVETRNVTQQVRTFTGPIPQDGGESRRRRLRNSKRNSTWNQVWAGSRPTRIRGVKNITGLLLPSRRKWKRRVQAENAENSANTLTYKQMIYYLFPPTEGEVEGEDGTDTGTGTSITPDPDQLDLFATLPFSTLSDRERYIKLLKDNDVTGAFETITASTKVMTSEHPFTEAPTAAPTTTPVPPDDSGGLSGGAIAGIIIAVVVAIGIFGIWYVYRPVEETDLEKDEEDDDFDHESDHAIRGAGAGDYGSSQSLGEKVVKKLSGKGGSHRSSSGKRGSAGAESVSNMSLMPFSTLVKQGNKGAAQGDEGRGQGPGTPQGILEPPGSALEMEGSAVVGPDGNVVMDTGNVLSDSDQEGPSSFPHHMLMVQEIEDM